MTIRRVALIQDGKVVNTIVVEDDPMQWPSYVRACNPPDIDVLAQLAESHDAVVELHDDEMCEPGSLVKPEVAELQPARAGEKVGVVRIDRTLVEAPVLEGDVPLDGKGQSAPVMVEAKSTIAVSRFERAPVEVVAKG